MKTYSVPVYWVMSGLISIEAESLVDACTKASEKTKDFSPLPEGEYVSDSLEIDAEVAEVLNEETLPPSCHGCCQCQDPSNDGLED